VKRDSTEVLSAYDKPNKQGQQRQGLVKINQFDPRADLALAQAHPLIVSHTPIKVLDATPPAQIPQCPQRWACRAACEMTSAKDFSPVSRHHTPNARVGRGVDSSSGRYRRVCRPSDVSYTFSLHCVPSSIIYGDIFFHSSPLRFALLPRITRS
jgi:hypothetical protein